MYKTVLVATAVSAAVLTSVATSHSTFATSDSEQNNKVTICHRTDAVNNPYVKITVSVNAAYGGHDEQHQGPVATSTAAAQALKDNHTKWGDIIPATTSHAGENWTEEGKTVYNHNCGCDTKSGPIVGPVDNKGNEGTGSSNTAPSSTVTPSGTASTPAATPASTSSSDTTPVVSELPHTGASNLTLIAGSIISILAGAGVYAGRFLRARFLPTL